jgi:hypothetical protein
MAEPPSPVSESERKLKLMSRLHLEKQLGKPLDQMLTTDARQPLKKYLQDIVLAVKSGSTLFGPIEQVEKVQTRLLHKFTKKRNVADIFGQPLNSKSPDVVKTRKRKASPTNKPAQTEVKAEAEAGEPSKKKPKTRIGFLKEQPFTPQQVLNKVIALYREQIQQTQDLSELDIIDNIHDSISDAADVALAPFKHVKLTKVNKQNLALLETILQKIEETADDFLDRYEKLDTEESDEEDEDLTLENIIQTLVNLTLDDLDLGQPQDASEERFDQIRAHLVQALQNKYPQDKYGNSDIDRAKKIHDPKTGKTIDRSARQRFFANADQVVKAYYEELTDPADQELLHDVQRYFTEVIEDQSEDTLPSQLLALIGEIKRGKQFEGVEAALQGKAKPTKEECLRLLTKPELQYALDHYDDKQKSPQANAPAPAPAAIHVPEPAPTPAPVVNVLVLDPKKQIKHQEEQLVKKQALLDDANKKLTVQQADLERVAAALKSLSDQFNSASPSKKPTLEKQLKIEQRKLNDENKKLQTMTLAVQTYTKDVAKISAQIAKWREKL